MKPRRSSYLDRKDPAPNKEHDVPRPLPTATADFSQLAEAEFRYARAAYTGRDDAPTHEELDQFIAASALGDVLQALGGGPKVSMLPRASGRRLMLSSPPPRARAFRVAV